MRREKTRGEERSRKEKRGYNMRSKMKREERREKAGEER